MSNVVLGLLLAPCCLFASGHLCTLTGTGSSGHTIAISTITNSDVSGTGCTAADVQGGGDSIILGANTYILDTNSGVTATAGQSAKALYGTVSSITVTTPGTSCTGTSASFGTSGTTAPKPSGGISWPSVKVTLSGGGVATAIMNPARPFLDTDSTGPTLGNPTGCSGTVLTPNFVSGIGSTTPHNAAAFVFNNSASVVQVNTGVTLTWAGWGLWSASGGTIIQKHGSTINIDSSHATANADGSYPMYVLMAPDYNVGSVTMKLDWTDCTLAAPCAINGNPSGTANSAAQLVNAGQNLVTVDIGYPNYTSGAFCNPNCVVNLSNLGDQIDYLIGNTSTGGAHIWMSGTGSTCTNCGPIYLGDSSTMIFDYSMFHKNPPTPSWSDMFLANQGGTTHRAVFNSVFSKNNWNGDAGCNSTGNTILTISNVWFGGTVCGAQAASVSNMLYANAGEFVTYTNSSRISSVTMNSSYFYSGVTIFNWHAKGSCVGIPYTGNNNIYDMAEDSNGQTSFNLGTTAASAVTCQDNNAILLPSKQGHGNGWLFVNVASQTNANVTLYAYHSTWWAQLGGDGSSMMSTDHSGSETSGIALKSSLVRGIGSANTSMKMISLCASPEQTVTCGGAVPCSDYNAEYNGPATVTGACSASLTNQASGYGVKLSGSLASLGIGQHDIDVLNGGTGTTQANTATNPQFADSARGLILWDSKYLRTTPSKGAWASTTTYTAGDTVSNTLPNVYCLNSATSCTTGNPINFVALVSHTASILNEPGLDLTVANGGISSATCSGSSVSVTFPSSPGLVAGDQVVLMFSVTNNYDTAPTKTLTSGNISGSTITLTTTNSSPGGSCAGLYISIWRKWWQYNSEVQLQNAISQGTTYTDGSIGCSGGCNAVQALVNWVENGCISLNPNLWVGDDGKEIGASSRSSVEQIPPLAVVQ